VAIRYIRQKDINFSLWDRCINNSLNGLVNANSWFLDIVAEHWDALVEDDYRSVMPLVYKERLFYKKAFNPYFSSQLGIFSMKPVTSEKIELFLKAIPPEFKKISVCLNRQNSQSIKNCTNCKTLKTFEMDLIIPYDKKKGLYSPNVNKSLSIAHDRKLFVANGTSLDEFLGFVMHYENKKLQKILLNPLQQIMTLLISTGKGEIMAIYDSAKILVSAACFVKSNQNVMMLYALSNKQGIEGKANYLILDTFLKNYSSRSVTLSLEHLDQIWSASFYSDFDAMECHYLCYIKNRFPFKLKWF
jgi:hypothetical protein